MPQRSGRYRKGLAVAAVVAALALFVRGFMEWRSGPGWAMVLAGVALLVAVALRTMVYRD